MHLFWPYLVLSGMSDEKLLLKNYQKKKKKQGEKIKA